MTWHSRSGPIQSGKGRRARRFRTAEGGRVREGNVKMSRAGCPVVSRDLTLSRCPSACRTAVKPASAQKSAFRKNAQKRETPNTQKGTSPGHVSRVVGLVSEIEGCVRVLQPVRAGPVDVEAAITATLSDMGGGEREKERKNSERISFVWQTM